MSIKSFEEMVLPQGTTVEEVIEGAFKAVSDRANRPLNMKDAQKKQEDAMRQAWLNREKQQKPAP